MTELTLIYYLGNDRPDLWESVVRAKADGAVVIVNGGLTLADDEDLADLRTRLGRMVVALRADGSAVLADELAESC